MTSPRGDRRGDGERLRLEPIAEDAVLGAAQPVDPLDLDPTLGGPLDPRAHRAEHGDEVVDLRLERRVVDDRRPARQGRGQHRVLGAHHRHDRELDPRAAQPARGADAK